MHTLTQSVLDYNKTVAIVDFNQLRNPLVIASVCKAHVKNIPFGNQVLNIAPNLHRPEARDVYIVEVRDREYSEVDLVRVNGLIYVPAY